MHLGILRFMKKNKILEIFHNKKTYIIVKFFVNFLFVIWFIWLLSSYYKNWRFEEWGIRMILLTLIISFWFVYKNFLEKAILKKCHGNDMIIVIKFIVYSLFLFSLIFLLNWFYKNLFREIEKWRETWDIWPFFIALFIVIWISFDKIVDSLFLSSFKIDENMDSLPESIEW